MQINVLLAIAFNVTLVVTCGYAWLLGGRPERIGAATNFSAAGLTVLLHMRGVASGAPGEFAILAIDLAVAACFFWLAVRTSRFWPVWAFGFALANLFTALAGALMPDTPLFAYQSGLGVYAYLSLAAMVFGTMRLPRDAPPDLRNGYRRSSCRARPAQQMIIG